MNTGYFALFFPFAGRNALVLTSFIRKRSDLPISGTKQALNYKSRGARPRLIFLSSYQGAFGLIGDFFSKISVLFEVPVFSKVVSITS